MTCKNAIVSCVLKKCMCDCTDHMESCKLSEFTTLKYPTFKQCLDIYKEYSGNELTSINVTLCRVRNALKFLNMNEDMQVNELTYKKAEELIDAARKAGKSTCTAIGMLNAMKAITSKKFRNQFEEAGVERFIFDFPDLKEERHDVVTMTGSQVIDVEQFIFDMRSSAIEKDKEMFKALFFERYLAMRPGDINRLKWESLENEFGKLVLRYIPHKTEKKTHKRSNITLGPRLSAMIKPFIGSPDEYVLSRKEGKKYQTKHSKFSGYHRELWARINKWYREHGICDKSKASYLNRRQRITEAFDKDGFKGAIRIGMNTPKIQEKHYIGNTEYVAS